jgi:hypothetical protein|tara:strand:- start:330 stop:662 length:333 start_codon:yes stop_codon:yes gene_type:complete
MYKSKFIISMAIFSVFMITTSIIKTKARLVEKKIENYEKNISIIKNNLYESQLDYFYLSSPEGIVKKINEFSDIDYTTMKHSNIYLSLDHFFLNQKKLSKSYIYERKIQK